MSKKRRRKPRAIGRPTEYRENYPEQAFKQCLNGSTDAELAVFFDVNEDTIHEWKKKHPEFSESLRRGKEAAAGEVANALYRAAVGYERTVEKVVGEEVQALKEWIPGDVQAQKYFLNNRARKHWRNDPEAMQTINNKTLQIPMDIIEAANASRKARLGE